MTETQGMIGSVASELSGSAEVLSAQADRIKATSERLTAELQDLERLRAENAALSKRLTAQRQVLTMWLAVRGTLSAKFFDATKAVAEQTVAVLNHE